MTGSHRSLVRALIALLALAALTSSAAAESLRLRRPSAGFWVGFHGGLTLSADTALSDQTLETANAIDGAFGIDLYYRTSRFDLGLLVDSIGSGTFTGDGFERCPAAPSCPVGARTRVAALLRWRYLDEHWGSLFMRLSPGWVAIRHSDQLRARAADELGWEIEELSELDGVIDEYNGGFTFGIDFGFMIYLTRDIAAVVEIETITTTSTLQDGDDEVAYAAFQTLLTVGIEASL